MINSIAPVQSLPDLASLAQAVVSPATDSSQTSQAAETASGKAKAPAETGAIAGKSSPQPTTQPDVRLTIEENGDHTGYVYKMVDRFTGKTIAEIPREAVSQLGASDSYSAGSVVSTSA